MDLEEFADASPKQPIVRSACRDDVSRNLLVKSRPYRDQPVPTRRSSSFQRIWLPLVYSRPLPARSANHRRHLFPARVITTPGRIPEACCTGATVEGFRRELLS